MALNADPTEKIKALMVAAELMQNITWRWMKVCKDYHLDDDPNVSQKYLGYGFELRAPNIAAAVNSTAGEVVTYNGEIVNPYFSSSDGVATKGKESLGLGFYTLFTKRFRHILQ